MKLRKLEIRIFFTRDIHENKYIYIYILTVEAAKSRIKIKKKNFFRGLVKPNLFRIFFFVCLFVCLFFINIK